MKQQGPSSFRNRILNGLLEETIARLRPDLEAIDMPLGFKIFEPDEKIPFVYFPENSMASVVANTDDGQCVEIGVIGYEGAAGLDVVFSVDSNPHDCMIQLADGAHRIRTDKVRAEFAMGGDFQARILLFNYQLMAQVSQTTLCNRLHQVEARLARWLLMCRDRAESNVLLLTQEFIATMLGVTRVSVSVAATALQSLKLIKYSRGRIEILDNPGLEEFTCECYAAVKKEYDRTNSAAFAKN